MNQSSSFNTTKNSINSKDTSPSTDLDNSIISIDTINKIISNIASNLEDLIIENFQSNRQIYVKSDIFFHYYIPNISIENYIKRIMKYSQMNISSLIIAIIYIDKMCEIQKYILCFNNIHRLILSACLLSVKYNEDINVNNIIFSKIGDESIEIVNQLEQELFFLLDFSLFVDFNYYEKYYEYFTKCNKSITQEHNNNTNNNLLYEC